MTANMKSSLVTSLETAAAQAGLVLSLPPRAADFHGKPTAIFLLGLPGAEAERGRSSWS